jgi:hypothetical protein
MELLNNHSDELLKDVEDITSVNKKLNLQIKIENFHKLSNQEVYQIVAAVLEDFDDVEILSIVADENNIVNIEFQLVDFNLKEFIENYLQERNDNIKQIASELNFNNCKEIEKFIGKSSKIKKDDPLIKNENCFVCFEPYSEGEHKRELPHCKHFFHKKCIDKWLKKKAQCPVCRDNILEEHIQHAIFEKAKHFGIELKNNNSNQNLEENLNNNNNLN